MGITVGSASTAVRIVAAAFRARCVASKDFKVSVRISGDRREARWQFLRCRSCASPQAGVAVPFCGCARPFARRAFDSGTNLFGLMPDNGNDALGFNGRQ